MTRPYVDNCRYTSVSTLFLFIIQYLYNKLKSVYKHICSLLWLWYKAALQQINKIQQAWTNRFTKQNKQHESRKTCSSQSTTMTVSHCLISCIPIQYMIQLNNMISDMKVLTFPEHVLIPSLLSLIFPVPPTQHVPTCISGRRPCVAPLWWQRHRPPIGAGPRWSRALRPLCWPGVFWSSASDNHQPI